MLRRSRRASSQDIGDVRGARAKSLGKERVCFAAIALAMSAAMVARAAIPSADPPPPSSFETEQLLSWVNTNINADGWRIADMSRREALFVQARPSDGGRVGVIRGLARWESFSRTTPEQAWRSALQTLEIACAGPWYREVSWVAYSGSNFLGKPVANEASAGDAWRKAEPNSILASAVELYCTAAAAAAAPAP